VRRGTFVGTALYVSPEMLNDNQGIPESDYWALGVILYRLTFGKPPFEGTHENLTFQKILNRELEFPEGADEITKDLIDNLLRIDPSERIKF
jgi:3-phosphoinositide dependent protein kinase-1